MIPACADLISALRSPRRMRDFSLAQWDRLIPQARSAGLLGRLGALAEHAGVSPHLPTPVQHALQAGLALSARQATIVRYELAQLDKALADLDIPILVLKGAAYVASDSPAAAGRLMSDIDILAQKDRIPGVEAALMLAGWVDNQHDEYDQRYYREWMHEIPPMHHVRRGTDLDVHHNLLPETARIKTKPELIIAAADKLPGMRCLHVPCAIDLILHSATHLTHEGEWWHGLRDLADMHAQIQEAAQANDEFWTELSTRGQALNLDFPLYYVLVHLERLFAMDIPWDRLRLRRPSRFAEVPTNWLLARGFASFHPSCHKPFTPLAEFILYVRSHWLRMPVTLLIPHLLRKAFTREKEEEE